MSRDDNITYSTLEDVAAGAAPALAGYDFVIFTVDRRDCEARDFTKTKSWQAMRGIASGAPAGQTYRIFFTGYDDDPRELWQIDAVRAFCLHIMRDCQRLYTLLHMESKHLLLLCTANKMPDGRRVVNPEWAPVEPNIGLLQIGHRW